MTRRITLLLLLLAGTPLAAQQREVRAMRAAPDVAIRLWVPAGVVQVEGWDHDSVEVRATPARGTRFGGGGTATAMKFSLENLRSNDTLLPSAQLRVFVPRKAKLWIKSTMATVHVREVSGELDVLQVAGLTTVFDASGVVTVESIDGATRLLRVNGVVRLRGGSGAARVEESSGTLDASLVSGNLLVSRNTVKRADGSGVPGLSLTGRIETVSGTVWFLGSLGRGGRLEISTHDGAVDLQLAGGPAPMVETAVPGATLDEAVRAGNPEAGRFVVRSFKGTVNAVHVGGI